MTDQRTCTKCGVRPASPSSSWCSACRNMAPSSRRSIMRAAKEKPCADCGLYEPEIMDFDHVPERGPKLFSIGNTKYTHYSTKALLEEIAKCDIVCPTCHRRRTNKRRQLLALSPQEAGE